MVSGRDSWPWKTADVTPIFKQGKREDSENYALISFTLISETVIEKLIVLQIVFKYIKNRKVFESSQSGFMKQNFCLTKLIDSYNEMAALVDEGRAANTADLDFWQKYFDVVF